MKKLILILGVVVPWTAFADVTFYDEFGHPTGSAERNYDGSWTFYDQFGHDTGSEQPGYHGAWTFYDRFGHPVGSQDSE